MDKADPPRRGLGASVPGSGCSRSEPDQEVPPPHSIASASMSAIAANHSMRTAKQSQDEDRPLDVEVEKRPACEALGLLRELPSNHTQ
jgi:hypothetical protein